MNKKNEDIKMAQIPDGPVEGQVYKYGEKVPKGWNLYHSNEKGLIYGKVKKTYRPVKAGKGEKK